MARRNSVLIAPSFPAIDADKPKSEPVNTESVPSAKKAPPPVKAKTTSGSVAASSINHTAPVLVKTPIVGAVEVTASIAAKVTAPIVAELTAPISVVVAATSDTVLSPTTVNDVVDAAAAEAARIEELILSQFKEEERQEKEAADRRKVRFVIPPLLVLIPNHTPVSSDSSRSLYLRKHVAWPN